MYLLNLKYFVFILNSFSKYIPIGCKLYLSCYEYLIYTPISMEANIDILLVLNCDFYIQDNRYKTLLSIPKSGIASVFEALFRNIRCPFFSS